MRQFTCRVAIQFKLNLLQANLINLMALLNIQEPGQEEKNQEQNEVIIGIDLGTTNSLVAIVEDGKARLLADENGCDIFPSIVEYDNGETRISSVKRLMGKSFTDVLQENLGTFFDFLSYLN